AEVGFVSVLLLPSDAEATLAQAALNDTLALQLLGSNYSANAHAYSLTYQNCNQWLAELLATAWGALPGDSSASLDGAFRTGLTGSATDGVPDGLPSTTIPPRARAQAWLHQQGYQATLLDVGWRPLLWLATLSPWLHTDDHPPADLAEARLRVSMPEGIAQFVHAQWPATQRLEFCYTADHVVLRRNGPPLPNNCQPAEGDGVVALHPA
ncbi:MAG: DUF2145 domain-containing protein, partial [Burkholderiales bacterium]|nr:DUF2145 domain-containing protein [Burkholderiales bacterium]